METTNMRSNKPRTTSKSGGSGKSTTRGTSQRAKNSSRTVPASFEEVFGKEKPLTEEELRWQGLRAASKARLEGLLAQPMPLNGLLRARHKQKLARERKLLRDLDDLTERGNN